MIKLVCVLICKVAGKRLLNSRYGALVLFAVCFKIKGGRYLLSSINQMRVHHNTRSTLSACTAVKQLTNKKFLILYHANDQLFLVDHCFY